MYPNQDYGPTAAQHNEIIELLRRIAAALEARNEQTGEDQ